MVHVVQLGQSVCWALCCDGSIRQLESAKGSGVHERLQLVESDGECGPGCAWVLAKEREERRRAREAKRIETEFQAREERRQAREAKRIDAIYTQTVEAAKTANERVPEEHTVFQLARHRELLRAYRRMVQRDPRLSPLDDGELDIAVMREVG